MKRLLLGLIFGLLAVGALADSFSLKDGSKVVGKVISSDAGSVTVQSESLGTLTIHREQLQALETPKPSPASPKPWSGTITGGYQRTQNSKLTDDVNLGFSANRDDKESELSLLGAYRFSADKDKNGKRSVTNNDAQLDSKYEWKLPAGAYAFVSTDFQHDGVNDVDLRWEAGVGAGKRFVDKKNVKVKLDIGIAQESYDFSDETPSSQFASVMFGGEIKTTIVPGTSLTARLVYHPSLRGGTRYHVGGGLGIQTKIASNWFFNLQFMRDYDSITSIRGKKDTSKWTLGIGYRF